MIFSFDETDYMATDSSNDRSTGSSWYWSDSSSGRWRGGESSGDSSRKPQIRPGTPIRFWRAPQGLVDVGRIPSESGDAPTPLPYDRILVLVMVLLGDTICMSVILPFVPFMVEGFLRGPEHDIGYYSGLLGAAYQLGQLCFPFWGAISDRVSRRPVMLGCLSASCVWLLLFGLAPSLTFAVVCRFAHGLCGGNVVVAKAMMADITDRSNETRAFVRVRVCVDGAC